MSIERFNENVALSSSHGSNSVTDKLLLSFVSGQKNKIITLLMFPINSSRRHRAATTPSSMTSRTAGLGNVHLSQQGLSVLVEGTKCKQILKYRTPDLKLATPDPSPISRCL